MSVRFVRREEGFLNDNVAFFLVYEQQTVEHNTLQVFNRSALSSSESTNLNSDRLCTSSIVSSILIPRHRK
jgi:hypothetical protein